MSYIKEDKFWVSHRYSLKFLKLCQRAYKEQPRNYLYSGSHGSALKVTVDGTPYWVKRIIKDPAIVYGRLITWKQIEIYNKKWDNLNSEITAAWDLTEKIPDYVSNLHAANIETKLTKDKIVYLIGWLVFEAPTGLTLKDFVKNKRYMYRSITVDLSQRLYCMIERARRALNDIGYVHRDIKPDNIFVITDSIGEPLTCKLIDFGFTVKRGERHEAIATPAFMPPDFPSLFTPHIVTSMQNEYSTRMIWSLPDILGLGQINIPPDPTTCASILSKPGLRATTSYGGGGGQAPYGGAQPSYGGGGGQGPYGGARPSYGGGGAQPSYGGGGAQPSYGGGGARPSYGGGGNGDYGVGGYPLAVGLRQNPPTSITTLNKTSKRLLGSVPQITQAAIGDSKEPPSHKMKESEKPNNNCCKCAGSFFGCCPCGKHKKEGGSRRLHKTKRNITKRIKTRRLKNRPAAAGGGGGGGAPAAAEGSFSMDTAGGGGESAFRYYQPDTTTVKHYFIIYHGQYIMPKYTNDKPMNHSAIDYPQMTDILYNKLNNLELVYYGDDKRVLTASTDDIKSLFNNPLLLVNVLKTQGSIYGKNKTYMERLSKKQHTDFKLLLNYNLYPLTFTYEQFAFNDGIYKKIPYYPGYEKISNDAVPFTNIFDVISFIAEYHNIYHTGLRGVMHSISCRSDDLQNFDNLELQRLYPPLRQNMNNQGKKIKKWLTNRIHKKLRNEPRINKRSKKYTYKKR